MDFIKTNWFFLLCILLLAWNAVSGYRKGFVRMLYRILCNLLALVLAAFAADPLGNFFKTHTSLYNVVEGRCVDFVSGVSGNSSLLSAAGVYDTVGEQAAQVVFHILMFVLAFVLIRIVFWIVMRVANGIAKAPVLRGINRFLGILAGCLNGLLLVWLLMAVFTIFQSASLGAEVMACIQRWDFLRALYEWNPLLFLADFFA